MLLTWLAGKRLEYPVYFDLEDPSLAGLDRETLNQFCVTFLTILQENGYYGALYSNQDWLANRLNQEPLKAAFDVWYARYPTTQTVTPTSSFTWNASVYGVQMGLWQYTSHGVIEGIDGVEFDFDYAYRDYPAIIKRFGYNGYEPTI
jgi:GH25 family lysozyme M1 (1,4-beta-N-acetylmuramidase)